MKINRLIIFFCFGFLFSGDIDRELKIAGKNKKEIQSAIRRVPKAQRAGMEWLIKHMPHEDLKAVSSRFLLDNCDLAYKTRKKYTWGASVPDSIFFEYVLPFASLNERRENWRKDFYYRFSSVTKSAASAYEAAAILNNKMFEMVGVKYSTKRPKADQAPYESMEAGLGSACCCCASLMVWDGGWHYTGAAEPTADELNNVWFSGLASRAVEGHPKYGIYAATWAKSGLHFPMDWMPEVRDYNAVDVTQSYIQNIDDSLVPIRIRALDSSGKRKPVTVEVTGEADFSFEGTSKSEACDLNDHLTLMLPRGKDFTIKTDDDQRKISIEKEEIVDLKILD